MPAERSLRDVLRNMLQYGDLSFRDFMELALYHPQSGYYATALNPVGKGADYVTAPVLSPVFSHALGNLVREFVSRNEGEVCSIVDIGCGDGGLIDGIARDSLPGRGDVRFYGVDRELGRITPSAEQRATFVRTLDEVPRGGTHLVLSNELYDAFPFARLVRRGEHVHELFVQERDGVLDWTEQDASGEYAHYFESQGIELAEGQFADVSLEWEAFHADVLRFVDRGLVVTIDYGFPAAKLFHPRARRFGTAAAYAGQRVSRDLLANPGQQDLTAHINFSDLERAGERNGARTLYFDRLAKFLLTLDVMSHGIFRPVEDSGITTTEEGLALIDAREAARRLVLPDGIGEEMRVLVQGKGVELEGWSFQKPLY